MICEDLRYAGVTLNKAACLTDPLDRMAYVTAFAVSAYAGMASRKQKPFNPLLGETFDFACDGWKYHAEQVFRTSVVDFTFLSPQRLLQRQQN